MNLNNNNKKNISIFQKLKFNTKLFNFTMVIFLILNVLNLCLYFFTSYGFSHISQLIFVLVSYFTFYLMVFGPFEFASKFEYSGERLKQNWQDIILGLFTLIFYLVVLVGLIIANKQTEKAEDKLKSEYKKILVQKWIGSELIGENKFKIDLLNTDHKAKTSLKFNEKDKYLDRIETINDSKDIYLYIDKKGEVQDVEIVIFQKYNS